MTRTDLVLTLSGPLKEDDRILSAGTVSVEEMTGARQHVRSNMKPSTIEGTAHTVGHNLSGCHLSVFLYAGDILKWESEKTNSQFPVCACGSPCQRGNALLFVFKIPRRLESVFEPHL